MTNYEKLIATLKEVFTLDKADLDFGIYRIMNQKRKDIEYFLEHELVPQVKTVLAESGSVDKAGLQKELDDAIKGATALGVDPDSSPKVQQLKARIGEAADLQGLENEVFSLLANFFKRYFDNGDFIAMRRYKKDVYAIPYEGEEVKLHWANADQYYIKTSEYFKNYRFTLSNGRTVAFVLTEAGTEQNNNKAQGDKERKFALAKEVEISITENELSIPFTYESLDKKIKQSDLLEAAFNAVKTKIPVEFTELLSPRPTEKDKRRTLLQKHLNDYAARNTFDYFIHKDLGGFLTRELDFYIKNEVLFIDDLNTRDEQEFLKQLSKIKAIKKIGEKIIAFLAQLENFQKKLWLKKKMVVECNYCITLDRVPKELYEEIAATEAQTAEWIKLFAIDEIKQKEAGLFGSEKVAFTELLTVAFLEQNPFLVLDTAFFNEAFKWKLIGSIENFDEQCDGLLINSENFQALQLTYERYKEQVKCIYIDPPYNKGKDFSYKDNFKDSSWLACLYDRLSFNRTLLYDKGVFFSSIDLNELENLKRLTEIYFSSENTLVLPAITNLKGNQDTEGFASTHEYIVCAANSSLKDVGRLKIGDEGLFEDWDTDEYGLFKKADGLRATGINAPREKRKNLWYPIFIDPVENLIYTNVENLPKDESHITLWPINDEGEELSWYWKKDKINTDRHNLIITRPGGGYSIYKKQRPGIGDIPTKKPKSIFYSPEYSSTNGGNLAQNIFGERMSDFTPKSVNFLEDIIFLGADTNIDALVLDYFAGSGTTGHAVINLNRDDSGKRKYILVEMGEYFDTVTKPRIQKVIYSKDWKDGKPVSREGISQCFKYMRLESYEDTLNNLQLQQTEAQQQILALNASFKEGYMLHYMLDVEAQGSLLNLDWFIDPFNCHLNITKNNELKPTCIDLVETFNYLIGLVVESYAAPKEGFVVVTGKNLSGEKILAVWRNCTQHDRVALNDFLQKSRYNPLDAEFDRIYVNGDNNVENLKTGDERWKVVLIEEEFGKRMFEEG